MKRFMIWSSVALVLVVAGFALASAAGPGHYGWRGREWGFHGPLGYVSHELNLSEAQKAQIKTMWDQERPIVATLVRDLASQSKEMDSATTQGNLDESKVQAIAAHQGETIAKLLIEKERFKSNIYSSVLNPDQRTKADAIENRWHSRLYHVADRIANGGGR